MNTPIIENISFAELNPTPAQGPALLPRDLELIRHVQVSMTATIGGGSISVERLFALRAGDVVSLDERVDEPVTLCIDGRPVARGLLVAVDDCIGVEITEILPA